MDKTTFSLDWNCVIEVEEGRAQAKAVQQLVMAHRQGRCDVALLATSASENTRSKRFPGNGGFFKARVAAIGFDDLPIVPAPGIIGLTYINWAFVVDEQEYQLLRPALWETMFPRFDPSARSHLAADIDLTQASIQSETLSEWRNRWCDVMSAYSHIHAKRDVFVTLNTKDFHKNAKGLASLGMKKICTPEECLSFL